MDPSFPLSKQFLCTCLVLLCACLILLCTCLILLCTLFTEAREAQVLDI